MASLKIGTPGPGYCHFPIGRDLEYFEQLSAEKKFTRYHNGFPKQEWRKPANAGNESLDARNYAYAALHALYAGGLKLAVHGDRFARMVAARRGESQPATRAAAPKAVSPESLTPAPVERGDAPWIPPRNWFGRN